MPDTSFLENTFGRFVLKSCISLGEEGMSRDNNYVRKKSKKTKFVIFTWFEGDINKKRCQKFLYDLPICRSRISQESKRPGFQALLSRLLAVWAQALSQVRFCRMQMSGWDSLCRRFIVPVQKGGGGKSWQRELSAAIGPWYLWMERGRKEKWVGRSSDCSVALRKAGFLLPPLSVSPLVFSERKLL